MWRRFASTKFILTAGSLATVFIFAWAEKPLGELAVLVPAILGMYMAGNVGQSAVNNKYGNNYDGSDSIGSDIGRGY